MSTNMKKVIRETAILSFIVFAMTTLVGSVWETPIVKKQHQLVVAKKNPLLKRTDFSLRRGYLDRKKTRKA